MSFLVATLLALAAVGTVVGAAFFMGLVPSSGVASASPTPRGSSNPQSSPSASATPAATPTPIPTPTPQPTAGGSYTVQPGDFLSGIGVKFGVPWQLIATANNIQPPDYIVQVGQVLVIPVVPQPSDGSNTYVVLAGDNITKIATKFGLDATTLADFNNLVDWNSIHPGDILYIPTTPNATPRPVPSPTE